MKAYTYDTTIQEHAATDEEIALLAGLIQFGQANYQPRSKPRELADGCRRLLVRLLREQHEHEETRAAAVREREALEAATARTIEAVAKPARSSTREAKLRASLRELLDEAIDAGCESRAVSDEAVRKAEEVLR